MIPGRTKRDFAGLSLVLTLSLLMGACQPEAPQSPAPRTASPPPSPSPAASPWFSDITESSGIHFQHRSGARGQFFMPEHIGSGAAVLDYDRDGRMDLYFVQNAGPTSSVPNQLFRQKEDGTFENRTPGSGLDISGHGMGAFAGDINNDGWPDLLVTEFGRIRLFLNLQHGQFREISSQSGIDNPHWGTAASFVDYDRDGWLDVVIANYVDYPPLHRCQDAWGALEYCGPEGFPRSVTRLFHNRGTGDGTFEDATVKSGLAQKPGPALGMYAADLTGDGWPDLLIADDASPNRLFVNQRNGTFTEEGAARGIAYTSLGQVAGNMGVAMGDLDGNGHPDVVITHLAEEHHGAWMQGPAGVYMERTAAVGLTRLAWRGTGFGNILADLDLDGDLDLALVNGRVKRSRALPPQLPPELDVAWKPYAQQAQLLQNNGQGILEDISSSNPELSGTAAVGRGLVMADLNNDGRVDLVTCNIESKARVLRNRTAQGHWLMLRLLERRAGGRDAIGAMARLRVGGKVLQRSLQPSVGYLSSQDPRLHFGLGTHASYESLEITWPTGEMETRAGGAADRILTLERP